MKKILNNKFLFFLLGILMASVSIVVATNYTASEITYTPKDSNWNVSNVSDALDSIYSKVKFCKLKSGAALAIGSAYECDPGDGIKRTFYILSKDGKIIDMIMSKNIDGVRIPGTDAVNYFTTGDGASYQTSWSNVLKVKMPTVEAIANISGINSINTKAIDRVWCFEEVPNISQDPWCSDSEALNQKYSWLTGWYWTGTTHSDGNAVWAVGQWPGLSARPNRNNETSYIRPVITVAEINLY